MMDELQLDEALYNNIMVWMRPKYAYTTIRSRATLMKKIFKEFRVLDHSNLKKIMQGFKYQYQRATLQMINNYCYDNDIDFSMRIPTIKAQAKRLPTILSPEEIKLMISSAPKPYDLAIRCLFNMGAGLRISEIIKFSWDDIRWVDWLGDQDKYGIALIKSGKGDKDRIVNIPKQLMKDLYEYAKEQRVLNEFRIPTDGMLFPFSFNNKRFKPKLLMEDIELWKNSYVRSRYDWFRYNIIELHCEKALNKRIKIHSLRHSRATYLYEVEKVPIEKIKVLLGHSSLNTTMIYTRVSPEGIFNLLKDTKEV